MDIRYSEEQGMLRDSVHKFIEQDYSFEARRNIIDGPEGGRPDNWSLFADLGWLTIPFSEEDGGYGGSATDIAIIMEEFGKGLVVEPWLTSMVLAGFLIGKLGSEEQKAALIEPLMSGELKVALAYNEPQARYSLADVSALAHRARDGYIVNGHKSVVLHGDTAERLIVVARTAGEQREQYGISFLLIDPDQMGVRRRAYTTVDGHRAAELFFDNVTVAADGLLGPENEAYPHLSQAVDRATIAVCAEAVGAMDTALWKTVDYTQQRKQFGVPIATYQALRHRMAEMYIECEQARSIVLMANLAMDADPEKSASAVSAAKVRVGKAAKRVGEEAVQIHGGIGVADESDIGHYLKRLTTIQYLFGSTEFHRQRYVELSSRL
jgi:alkylation response protein AidB-like acyl-CoA dehydrogenase